MEVAKWKFSRAKPNAIQLSDINITIQIGWHHHWRPYGQTFGGNEMAISVQTSLNTRFVSVFTHTAPATAENDGEVCVLTLNWAYFFSNDLLYTRMKSAFGDRKCDLYFTPVAHALISIAHTNRFILIFILSANRPWHSARPPQSLSWCCVTVQPNATIQRNHISELSFSRLAYASQKLHSEKM